METGLGPRRAPELPNPKLSICIPNYNNARYLRACIESAIAVDWDEKEIIVVDDGSSDNSVEILQGFDGIQVHTSEQNEGQPAATNRCIAASSGEYVTILHSDDCLLPNHARDLVPVLEAYPEVGLAAGERHETDESGVPHTVAALYDRDCIVPGEQQAKVFMFTSFLPCQVVVRRALLEAVGGVDPQHIVNLDGLLWFKCALRADVAYVRRPVCVYRRHRASTTARCNRSGEHVDQYLKTLEAMFDLARGRPYLERHFVSAQRRAGQLAIRFAEDMAVDRNYPLARRYLERAQQMDKELAHDDAYGRVARYVSSADTDRPDQPAHSLFTGMHARRTPYAPPEGARAITQ